VKNYVLGFAFDAKKERVVLIKKNGNSVPAHQGRLNGVGGKIEVHETSYEAMRREFREETGVDLHEFLWTFQGQFSGEGYSVKVFSTAADEIKAARTMESELVNVVRLQGLPILAEYDALCPYVSMLIGLCLNPTIKKFSFEEV